MSSKPGPSNLSSLPALPLDEWERTKETLHLYMQIVGKLRLQFATRRNHWWNITLYLSPKGITTGPIQGADGFTVFEITLNFLEHQLEIVASNGLGGSFALLDGLSVAEFYEQLRRLLGETGIKMSIQDRVFDVPGISGPFSTLTEYAAYQSEYVSRYWRILLWVDGVFKEFSGRFYGKTCPVHLYWHHMDLAVTRFSGKRGLQMPAEGSAIEKDSYSHEVVSFGFWAGDAQVRKPAFYSYASPEPQGLGGTTLAPAAAQWVETNGAHMAMLFYDDLRPADDPRAVLLDFLESAYAASAGLAGWDVKDLAVPALSEL